MKGSIMEKKIQHFPQKKQRIGEAISAGFVDGTPDQSLGMIGRAGVRTECPKRC
jgi:hypothetical protein